MKKVKYPKNQLKKGGLNEKEIQSENWRVKRKRE